MCYEQALVLDPYDASALDRKGHTLHELGEKEEALKCFDKALESDPKLVTALYGRGNVCFALGGKEEAVKYYDKALILVDYYSALNKL